MKRERLKGKSLEKAAAAGNMCERTARSYLSSNIVPSESRKIRDYRTREDAFDDVWQDVRKLLIVNPGLQAKTIFEHLQREQPGQFQNSQLRTLQRRIKTWRAQEGPGKEVFFTQVHVPGKQCQSDFTSMKKLNVTIAGSEFDHLFYHLVLTYSNWETGTICYSESFEALSDGLQNALWELGGVPVDHRTDRLSAAVNNQCNKAEFSQRYQSLLKHYKLQGSKSQPASPNENGDVEQSHYRFKTAVDQALMLRGSRDFDSIEKYNMFLKRILTARNEGRKDRFYQEQKVLKPLPSQRLQVFKSTKVRVTSNSVIRVGHNRYSVPSRLIGEWVKVHQYADLLKVFYADQLVQEMPRLRGENKHHINYRHLIHSLVRKPGAFENYKYREFMFPSSNYRLAFDRLKDSGLNSYVKKYLKLLHLAATEGEEVIELIICSLMNRVENPEPDVVKEIIAQNRPITAITEITIEPVNLHEYDSLLQAVI